MKRALLSLPLLLCANGDARPDWANRLIAGYPGLVAQVTAREVILSDGTRFPVSDGISGKSVAQRQAAPDFDDMFAEPYPASGAAPPRNGEDPGRIRFRPFFDAVYGDCAKGQVASRLRAVRWLGGGSVKVTTVNGVDRQLERVVRDLAALPPAMKRYLVPSAGTYLCRDIAGTAQRSMHAYGIAIDIATAQADYWRWSGGEKARYRNRIPAQIVSIFERHGFIWGGRWSHFDTMHFEYRPELLPPR